MPLPFVSVITPAYNAGKYIRQTVDSVLSQNYPRLEYIVLNDGSKDDTSELLRTYGSRLRYVEHANMGEQATVNKGLELAQGDLLMVVNADDPLLLDSIACLSSFLLYHREYVGYYPDWDCIDGEGHVRLHTKGRPYDYLYMVKHHYCIQSVGTMFRNMGVMRDTSFKYVGDFDFWLRFGLLGEFAHLPMPLATWRKHAGQGTSESGLRMADEHVRLIEKFYNLPMRPELVDVKNTAYCWAYLVAAGCCKTLIEAKRYVMAGLRYDPKQIVNVPAFYRQFHRFSRNRIWQVSPNATLSTQGVTSLHRAEALSYGDPNLATTGELDISSHAQSPSLEWKTRDGLNCLLFTGDCWVGIEITYQDGLFIPSDVSIPLSRRWFPIKPHTFRATFYPHASRREGPYYIAEVPTLDRARRMAVRYYQQWLQINKR